MNESNKVKGLFKTYTKDDLKDVYRECSKCGKSYPLDPYPFIPNGIFYICKKCYKKETK